MEKYQIWGLYYSDIAAFLLILQNRDIFFVSFLSFCGTHTYLQLHKLTNNLKIRNETFQMTKVHYTINPNF